MEGISSNSIFFVRHGEALKVSDRTPEQYKNPPLSDKGQQQSQDLVQAISPLLQDSQNAHLISSPMLRALETSLPLAQAMQKQVLVHGGFYEFSCCGKTLPGSSKQDIMAQSGNVDVEFTHFNSDQEWWYQGSDDVENEQEFKARGREAVQYLAEQAKSQPMFTQVVFAHATFIDFILNIMLKGNDSDWQYGNAIFRQGNCQFVEIVVVYDRDGFRFKVGDKGIQPRENKLVGMNARDT